MLLKGILFHKMHRTKASLVQREVGREQRHGGIVQMNLANSHWLTAKRKHCTASIPQSKIK